MYILRTIKRVAYHIWQETRHNWAIAIIGALLAWLVFSGFVLVTQNQLAHSIEHRIIYKNCAKEVRI